MLKGVNLEATSRFCDAVDCQVIASGGVTSRDDIVGLLELGKENLGGVIVGKALYDGRVDLADICAIVG
jgi:phosphoribosylformimino-5-aminoimidazole carboxamide ribotide isomerase